MSSKETLTTKEYVDGKLANVAANFTVKGDNNGAGYELNKDNTELKIGKQITVIKILQQELMLLRRWSI